MAGRSYYMLIASLPALPPHFEVQRDPITRPRLDERLKMLEPEDGGQVTPKVWEPLVSASTNAPENVP